MSMFKLINVADKEAYHIRTSPLTTLTTVCMVMRRKEAKPNTEKELPAGHVLRAVAAGKEVVVDILVAAPSSDAQRGR